MGSVILTSSGEEDSASAYGELERRAAAAAKKKVFILLARIELEGSGCERGAWENYDIYEALIMLVLPGVCGVAPRSTPTGI